MILRVVIPLIVVLAICSCSRRAAVSHSPAIGGKSGVRTTFQMHAANALYAGEGDLATARLRQRIAANPKDLEARMALASQYQDQGLTELALEHCRLAAIEFPTRHEPVTGQARALRRLSMQRQAAATVDAFLEANPGASWEAHSWSGILHDELGELQQAETAHREALARGQAKASLHNNLGYNLLLQERDDEAAAEFRKALAADSRSEVARNNLGLALSARPAEAVEAWSRAGGKAAAHNNLAAVHIESGRYQEARQELNAALSYKADYAPALRNLRLVSELDGREPVIERRASQSCWRKFTSVLEKVFLTPAADSAQQKQDNGAVQAASNN